MSDSTISPFEFDRRVASIVALTLAVFLVVQNTFRFTVDWQLFTTIEIAVGLLSILATGHLLLLIAGISYRQLSKQLVYVIATSCAYLVAIGMTSDLLLRAVGVARPIDLLPWIHVVSFVAILGIVHYRTEVTGISYPHRSVSTRFVLVLGYLVSVPLLSVAAARVMNQYGSNLPMLLSIGFILLSVWLLVSGDIPSVLRPFAVWSISISVLLQMTLISPHIWGWDVHFEYYVARKILVDGAWNPSYRNPGNSLLTATYMASMLSSITGLRLVTVYKVVYPFIASFLPVAVYQLARNEFRDEWVATLSPLVLVFYYGFFKIMPDKQILAQFFMVLLLLTLFDDELDGTKRAILSFVLATLVVFSHYGVSLLLVGFFAGTVFCFRALKLVRLVDSDRREVIKPTFTLLVAAEWFVWYLLSAGGINYQRVVTAGQQLLSIGSGGSSRSGVGYATKIFGSPLWFVYKFIYIAVIGLVCLGVVWTLYVVLRRKLERPHPEFVIFSMGVLAFVALSLVVTLNLGFDRTLLIAFAVIAPFAIIGLKAIGTILSSVTSGTFDGILDHSEVLFAVLLITMFTFSSGAAFAVTGEQVPSYSINLNQDAGWPVYGQSEVDATRWLDGHRAPGSSVGVLNQWSVLKSRDALIVREVTGHGRTVSVSPTSSSVDGRPYIYLSDKPVVHESGNRTYIEPKKSEFYQRYVTRTNKVYAAPHVAIYRAPASANASGR